MSPKKRRRGRAASRHHVCRPTEPLSIVSTRVLDGTEPLRLVTRNCDGSWQFLDGRPIDVDQLISTHAHHLFDEFPADLRRLRLMPPGNLAVRDDPWCPWRIEPYVED